MNRITKRIRRLLSVLLAGVILLSSSSKGMVSIYAEELQQTTSQEEETDLENENVDDLPDTENEEEDEIIYDEVNTESDNETNDPPVEEEKQTSDKEEESEKDKPTISGNNPSDESISGNDPIDLTEDEVAELRLYAVMEGEDVQDRIFLDQYEINVGEPIPVEILDAYGTEYIWYSMDGEEYDTERIVEADLELFAYLPEMKGIYYTGQSIEEILRMEKAGLELKEFFKYTVFKNFTKENLKDMQAYGISFEGLMMYAFFIPEIMELEDSDDTMDQIVVEEEYQLMKEEGLPIDERTDLESLEKIEEVEKEAETAKREGGFLEEIYTSFKSIFVPMKVEAAEVNDEEMIGKMNSLVQLMSIGNTGVLNFRGKITRALGNIPAFGSASHGGVNTMTITSGGETFSSWCAKYGAPANSGMTYNAVSGSSLGFSQAQMDYMAGAIGWYYYFTAKYPMDLNSSKQLLMVPQVFIWLAAAGNMYYTWDQIYPSVASICSKAYDQTNFNPANMETYFVSCLAYMTKTPQTTTLGKVCRYDEKDCIPATLTFWSRGAVNQWQVSGERLITDPVLTAKFTKMDAESLNPLSDANIDYGAEFTVYGDAGFSEEVAKCTDLGDGMYEYPLTDIMLYLQNKAGTGAGGLPNPLPAQSVLYVKETKAPYGYYLDPDINWSITIDSSGNIIESTLNVVNIPNDYQYLNITVNKKDNESGEGPQGDADLDGAIYALYAAEDIQHPDGITGTVYQENEFIETVQIENGTASFEHLYEGKYYVVEVQTRSPEEDIHNLTYERTMDGRALSVSTGYLVDETIYTVEARYDGNQNNSHISRTVTSYEQVEKSSAYFYKYGSQTGNGGATVPLAGAGFTFYLISDLSKADQFEKDVLRNVDNTPILDRNGDKIPSYSIQSILDAYLEEHWYQDGEIGSTNNKRKYDFRNETAAIAKVAMNATDRGKFTMDTTLVNAATYYMGADDLATYYENISGNWYQTKEVFSDSNGLVRIPYLPYGQYLVVESTTPKDRITADPFILTMYPDETKTTIVSAGVTDKTYDGVNVYKTTTAPGYVITNPLESEYFAGNVWDESVEQLLKIYKQDADTFETVLASGVGFKIYQIKKVWDDNAGGGAGGYVEQRSLMTQTVTYPTTITYDTFYTEADGTLRLPYLLAAGTYEIEEVKGPEGYWLNRDNVIRFQVTTEREFIATGETIITDHYTQAARDVVEIKELYYNDETRGRISIMKYGERLVSKDDSTDEKFLYNTLPIEGAEYTITAAEDIYTQDGQTDGNGKRNTWYQAGDIAAIVKTGENGQIGELHANRKNGDRYLATGITDSNAFKGTFGSMNLYESDPALAPFSDPRTYAYNESAVYQGDFDNEVLSDTVTSITTAKYRGNVGEVIVELPLGSYWVEETAAPVGYTKSEKRYLVRFTWENQDNRYVEGELIGYDDGTNIVYKYNDLDGLNPAWDEIENQLAVSHADNVTTLAFQENDAANISASSFYNDRITDTLKITKYAAEDRTSLIPGVEFTLYTEDDIYAWDGVGTMTTKLYSAGDAIATAVSDLQGVATFMADLPVKGLGEKWGSPFVNTGKYFVKETNAPSGVLLSPLTVSFTKTGDNTFVFEEEDITYSPVTNTYASAKLNVSIEGTQYNRTSHVDISKQDITNAAELPGARLQIVNGDGSLERDFISTNTPTSIRGLSVNERDAFLDILADMNRRKDDAEYHTLIETRPADGYATAVSIDFALVHKAPGTYDANDMNDDYNEVYIWREDVNTWIPLDENMVVMVDETIKMQISKQDITTSAELPGAKLTVTDKNGAVVDQWVSGNTPHFMEGKLIAGETYTLTEVVAPSGYSKAESITFMVLDTGLVQSVVMKDAPSGVPTPPGDHHHHKPSITPEKPVAPVIPEVPVIEKTGDSTNKVVLFVILLACFAGILVTGRLIWKQYKALKNEN